jgi:hypothetical protein
MLKTISVGLIGGGSNGTVTNVATGTGLTGGPITTTGTIALANTTVTANTYGNASSVSQIVINSQGQATSASNVAIAIGVAAVSGAVPNTVNVLASGLLTGGGALTGNVTIGLTSIPSANVSGLGTMATQNANAVVITGGNATLTTITANNYIATANIAPATTAAAYSYGTLSYTDINMFASYSANIANFVQIVLQNTSNSSSASTDFVVSNDAGSPTINYGDFGINSSTFSGTGNFQKAGAVYLYASSSDISIGTWSANAIHFIAGSSTNADAMTVNANNTVTIATLAQSTSSTATFATSSLPLVPAGYIIVNNNGTNVKIPYYAV